MESAYRKTAVEIVALALVLAFAAGLAWSAVQRKSVTVDEFTLAPEGLAILRSGTFHMDNGVPPLGKVLSALPLHFTDAVVDSAHVLDYTTGWDHAIRFESDNADRYHDSFLLCRAVSALGLVVLGGVAYRLGRRLYGPRGGLIAAFFTCLNPNLLAHSGLATADVFFTTAFVGVLLAIDRTLVDSSWWNSVLLGACFGAAALLKFTGVLLFVFAPLGLVAVRIALRAGSGDSSASGRRFWLGLPLALASGVAVIHAGYLGDGAFTRLGDFAFDHERIGELQSLLPAWLPVPLPYDFVKGLDSQLAEGGYVSYLLGKLSSDGFPHYYLVALLVKTPLPLIALCLASLWAQPRPSARELPGPALSLSLVVFFSLAGHKNIGVRYVLFVYPVFALWIARLAQTLPARSPRIRRSGVGAVAIGMLATAVETGATWPDFIPYFNPLAGGAGGGHRVLLDSNLDWGQDLPALQAYLEEKGIEEVDLAYYGRVKPERYGIRYRHLFQGRENRYAAISANLLWGRMYFVNGSDTWLLDPNYFAAYRKLEPVAVLGHSIYVFDHEEWNTEF